LPGQEYQRQPHQGSEAVQGTSKLGLAKDKIQKLIIPAEAELVTHLQAL